MANRSMMTGRLASDPKHVIRGELHITEIRLAVRRRPTKSNTEPGAFFIKVVTFGRLADACEKYLKKGSRVAVDGELDVREWERDGQRNWTPQVTASSVEFLDPPTAIEPSDDDASAEVDQPVDELAERRELAEAAA